MKLKIFILIVIFMASNRFSFAKDHSKNEYQYKVSGERGGCAFYPTGQTAKIKLKRDLKNAANDTCFASNVKVKKIKYFITCETHRFGWSWEYCPFNHWRSCYGHAAFTCDG